MPSRINRSGSWSVSAPVLVKIAIQLVSANRQAPDRSEVRFTVPAEPSHGERR
jgi:hypothetical protein